MEPQASQLRETQRRYLETIALSFRPNTVINSRAATNAFIRYLGSEHPQLSSFSQLHRSHIEGWLRHLANRQLKRSTRRNFVIKARVFLETIQAWGWTDAPPVPLFRQGDLPPEDRTLPRPLSRQSDEALREDLQRRGGLIHKALLLLRTTGMRSQELMDLKVHSLRQLPGNQWALHVPLGKLHSERVIPVDPATARLFQDILELRGQAPPVTDPETGRPDHFLLAHSSGRRFNRNILRYHLAKIEREAGLKEHPTPHRLRHSFATEMLRAGMGLPVLMKLLGHRTIGMTLRYAEVTGADVQRAYAEALTKIQGKYDIPLLPLAQPVGSRFDRNLSAKDFVLAQLRAAATAMEAFRRDHVPQPLPKKHLQRLLERVRRLATDFDAAVS